MSDPSFSARGIEMPFEIVNADGYLYARLYGVFTPQDLNQLAIETEQREAEAISPQDRIGDLTAVEQFQVGFDQIYSFAIRRSAQRFSRTVRSAIVVREPVQLGIARMYKSCIDNPQIELRIVNSVFEAIEWFAELRRPVTG